MSPRLLAGLYPPAWRERYGAEFETLLEDHPPSGMQVIDIIWGALDAHLFPQAPEGRIVMFTRISGVASIGVGLALLIGFMGFIPDVNRYTVPTVYVLAVIGLIGVHICQVAARPGLAWFGFVPLLLGLTAGITSIVLSSVGVLPPTGGEFGYVAGIALWIGAAAFGAAMLAIRVFPMLVGLAFSLAAPLAMIGLFARNAVTARGALDIAAQLGIVLFALAWIGVGASLFTRRPHQGVLGPSAT
ncbi:MAG TPA: hypothetical protein VIH19_08625 [Candidatus Limnocylindria bacterium]